MNISVTLDGTGFALAATFVCLVASSRVERYRLTRRQPMHWLTITLDALAVITSLVAVVLSGFTPWVVAVAVGLTVIMLVSLKVAAR